MRGFSHFFPATAILLIGYAGSAVAGNPPNNTAQNATRLQQQTANQAAARQNATTAAAAARQRQTTAQSAAYQGGSSASNTNSSGSPSKHRKHRDNYPYGYGPGYGYGSGPGYGYGYYPGGYGNYSNDSGNTPSDGSNSAASNAPSDPAVATTDADRKSDADAPVVSHKSKPVLATKPDDDEVLSDKDIAKQEGMAEKFVALGDSYFGKQNYVTAVERYHSAERQAPKSANAWFHQGFALAAVGKYDEAAKAMRQGLQCNAGWAAQSGFHLDDLYGTGSDAKKRTLDAMVNAAQADESNADLAFVLGVHFYFDGQQDKSSPWLKKAAQLAGSDADVKGFLAKD